MLRHFGHRLGSLSRSWCVWNTTVAIAEIAEEDKTYIQRVAPNTVAAKTWLYQAWPKDIKQGDGSSILFPVMNFEREKLRTIVLGGDVFNVPVRKDILHRVVRWQRARKQQGTHKTKTRAEVRGGGRKPWRQKGLGRARAGSIRAPHWRGGGKAHGPVPRSHEHKLNKKVRRLGLKCALSAKAVENRLMVVDAIDAEERKTKVFYARLMRLLEGAPRLSVFMVDGTEEAKYSILVRQSSRNIQGVKMLPAKGVNVYDILKHDIVVMSEEAVNEITQFLRSKVNR